jgi:hypothetical protein
MGRKPGPTCQYTTPQKVDDGTSCRTESPTPTPLGLCTEEGRPDFSWGYWDAVKWKVLGRLPAWMGGNPNILRNYKDAWVRAHRDLIKALSTSYGLPPELLGGVAWIETGGKPYSLKIDVYEIRRFTPLTKQPELTSMGPVAIQLRRAAEAMGVEFSQLSASDKSQLVDCLQNADNDLGIVAKHLWQLKQIDFPDRTVLGKYEVRIIATRYNRGPDLSLQRILQDTSYGDFIIDKNYGRIQELLNQ